MIQTSGCIIGIALPGLTERGRNPRFNSPVPHEGVFALEVHAGEELIGMLRVLAAQEEDENEGEEDEHE